MIVNWHKVLLNNGADRTCFPFKLAILKTVTPYHI